MIKINPENGYYEEMFQYETPEGGKVVCAIDISPTWHPLLWSLITLVDDGSEDKILIWAIEVNNTNFEIGDPAGIVNAESTIGIDFVFRGDNLSAGEYPFYVGFGNNACENENDYISVNMYVSEPDQVDPGKSGQPREWAFKGAYPNPFNPIVNIEFSLRSDALVQARVYNLMGQEVAVLADHMIEAGHQSLTFDGSNLASGMYFLQFNAGPISEMKKLILLK